MKILVTLVQAVWCLAITNAEVSNSLKPDVVECTVPTSKLSQKPPTAAAAAVDLNLLRDWANTLPALLKQDEDRTRVLLDKTVDKNSPIHLIRNKFYQVTSQSLQTVCTVGKLIGGEWLGNCGTFDGQKFVCLDKIYTDVVSDNCLVYSFGIADDWSFEEVMAGIGCKVRAFDPTTSPDSKPDNANITFEAVGLSHKSGTTEITDNLRDVKVMAKVETLKSLIKKYGDAGKRISYLKIDIESSELEGIHEWISSGVLSHVDQIGIEFHTGQVFLSGTLQTAKTLGRLLEALQQLYNIGFKLISNTPNNCVGKSQDQGKQFYTFFDVVLYRP